MTTRLRARDSAALATSVHIIFRLRSDDTTIGDWTDFLRLANALSALYPRGSQEKRLLDATLLAVPRQPRNDSFLPLLHVTGS